MPQDFTVAGGSLGFMHARKNTKKLRNKCFEKCVFRLIGINDSGGARIQEGVNSLAGYGEIFFRNTRHPGLFLSYRLFLVLAQVGQYIHHPYRLCVCGRKQFKNVSLPGLMLLRRY
jgi:hypothetical protein